MVRRKGNMGIFQTHSLLEKSEQRGERGTGTIRPAPKEKKLQS